MSGSNIIYTSEIINLNDKISKISDNYNNLLSDLVMKEEEITREELINLKQKYALLHQEIKQQHQKLSALKPEADLSIKHTELTTLFDKLDKSSRVLTDSLDVGFHHADVGNLIMEFINEQNGVEEIKSITQELVNKLTN